MSELSHNLVKTDQVIGVKVINQEDNNLGKIEELVLNKYEGNVEYAVLSFGGIMGIGDKLFPLPWKSLSYEPDKNAFVINESKERLKNAPGFDKAHWPDLTSQTFTNQINTFYI
ncbi:MAG: PRC-barrel domain-containing protein [Legionellales bacterium]|nr:PRC-barrel domain-containing protein [Legionellales bacterium]